MKTKENGVTLIALVATIIILLILASVGTTVGISTLNTAKFNQFKSEIKILQTKVNELNQKEEFDIGEELTEEQKEVFNITTISNIIFNGKTEDEKTKIKNSFRYCNKDYIKSKFNMESIDRNYLINIKYRYIIFGDGLEYNGDIYYMIDQIEDGVYNVEYNDKNDKTGSFEVTAIKENNKWKIDISNIVYNGYVNKWQVKYKLDGTSYWNTSENTNFYINEPGRYTFKVVHGDNIDLGNKTISVLKEASTSDGSWNGVVNTPKTDGTGLIPVYFGENGETIELTEESSEEEWLQWYNYSEQKWANAVTKDTNGNITGYFVWIPRYQYKINDNQTISVDFIKVTQRIPDDIYTYVHPSFTNGTNTNYMNGEWDKEIPGFWVAKYQAGYQQNTITDNKDGTVSIPKITINEDELAMSNENYNSTISSSRPEKTTAVGYITKLTKMTYPVFLPLTYVYNWISAGDAYTLSKDIENGTNFYGLKNTDSHMMKNSEWGALAYLTQSEFGRNGVETNANEYCGDTSEPYRTTITGVYSDTTTAGTVKDISKVYAYYKDDIGIKGSTTGNITGVYDLNGAGTERVAAYIANGNSHLSNGSSFVAITQVNANAYKTLSTKYATIYPYNSSNDSADLNKNVYSDLRRESNETYGYGDAILETEGWNGDNKNYLHTSFPIFTRGGRYGSGTKGGIFTYAASYGDAYYYYAFRTVLIPD